MTDVLILGGTGWLGSRIAERWLDAGASVTCLARGGRDAPYGARLVVADRDVEGAYDAVRGRDWDEIVDVSSRAAHVAGAATALSEWARHITFVSSVSAYAADDEPDADESAPLAEPAARRASAARTNSRSSRRCRRHPIAPPAPDPPASAPRDLRESAAAR